jgi:CPA2 family monovalent cation:H+ antiporter-2
VAIIIFGKSLIAYLIVRAFGHPNETALTVSASLAQIGEFSFILAGLGTGLGILPPEARDLILAGAILSILANPFIFSLAVGRAPVRTSGAREAAAPATPAPPTDHTILVGFGRVGRLIAAAHGGPGKFVVIEARTGLAQHDGSRGLIFIEGNAADPAVLEQADIEHAARLLLAIPGGFEAGAIAQNALALNPAIQIIARAHSDEDVAYLEKLGADHVIMGEREIAARMVSLLKAT